MTEDIDPSEKDQESPRLLSFRSCLGARAGDKCPSCKEGILDYDGWVTLACPKCGYQSPRGGFT